MVQRVGSCNGLNPSWCSVCPSWCSGFFLPLLVFRSPFTPPHVPVGSLHPPHVPVGSLHPPSVPVAQHYPVDVPVPKMRTSCNHGPLGHRALMAALMALSISPGSGLHGMILPTDEVMLTETSSKLIDTGKKSGENIFT